MSKDGTLFMDMETIDIDKPVCKYAYTLNQSNAIYVFQVEGVEFFSLEVEISEPRL